MTSASLARLAAWGKNAPETFLAYCRLKLQWKKLSIFWQFKLLQLLCAIYSAVAFSDSPIGIVDPSSGGIIDTGSAENTANGVILIKGDYRPLVAEGPYQMICLAVARISAFYMYPAMAAVFLTKCKALMEFLLNSPCALHMITDLHDLHSYSRKNIAVSVWIHTLAHMLRWVDQGNISLLWEHRAGFSGLVVVVATPIITLPMMYWKRSIPYEIRKGIHYLFYIFAIGLCFHAPPSGIPKGGFIAYVMGFSICVYTVDVLYIFFFMIENIETTQFHVLGGGVFMNMHVSE